MNKIYIVSGFSGSGKGTLIKKVLEESADLEIVKSCTTRPKRSEDDFYTFVDDEKFDDMEENRLFLESNTYNGYRYGTPLQSVKKILDEDKSVILEIDVNGFRKVIESGLFPRDMIYSIFVAVDSKTLLERLMERETESIEQIIPRMKNTLRECKEIGRYDCVVVNDELDNAVRKLLSIMHSNSNDMLSDSFDEEEFETQMQALINKLEDIDSLESLMRRVETFCKIRNWDQYNNPKDLSIGVLTEASELLEIWRFKTEEQMEEMIREPQIRIHVGEEMADVLFFLMRFASKYQFNLVEVLIDKIIKNAAKYPVSKVKGKNLEYEEY